MREARDLREHWDIGVRDRLALLTEVQAIGIRRSIFASAIHCNLMNAPEGICAATARVLEAGSPSALDDGQCGPRPGKRALLLGRSYIIASGFTFEARA
jgi:hypothetical protein